MRFLCLPMLGLLLFASLLAGCTDPGPDPAPEGPGTSTDPDDLYDLDGNDPEEHVHDYWNGQDVLRIRADLEETQTTAQGGFPSDPIRPTDRDIFPQGTGKVELTVSWEDDSPGRYHDVGLFVKTAGDHQPSFLAEVENGDTVEMTVNNTHNDLPHQVLSNWYFVLWFDADMPDAIAHFDGTIRIDAVAYRELEIPAFHGHPDHWKNETVLPVLDHREDAIVIRRAPPAGGRACVQGCFDTHRPDNGTIIPPKTDHVEVVLTRDAATDLQLHLGFHGSGTTEITVREPDEADGDTQRFYISMDEARPDGPYAIQSQWEFEVYTGDDEVYRPYVGGYTLQVTAHREAA